ncbi:MAG: efflux RND transporter periplasmic adaptor subunit [Tepidisphaeraceae bacterium]
MAIVLVVAGVIGVFFRKPLLSTMAATPPTAPDDSSAQAGPFIADGDTIAVDNSVFGPAGIDLMKVEAQDVPMTLTLTAKSGLNMDTVTHVSALFGGKVTDIRVGLGDIVKGPDDEGGPSKLCVIESNDLAQDKAAWLQSLIQLRIDEDDLTRTKSLFSASVVSEKALIDAESSVMKDQAAEEAARQQLLVFGLTDNDIDDVRKEAVQEETAEKAGNPVQSAATQRSVEDLRRQRMGYVLTAPRGGVIAEKFVAGGETAVPQTNLFTIADTRTLWIWADVYERDLSRVKAGQTFKVYFTSEPDRARESKIDWISPVLDPNTHSVKLRGLLDNSDGHILSDMYGTMVVTVDDGKNSIVLPATAVQRVEDNAFVFVQVGQKGNATVFRRTPVKVEPVDVGFGAADAASAAAGSAARNTGNADESSGSVRVADGLHPNDLIVVSGGVGLLNEMKEQEHAQQTSAGGSPPVAVAQ